MNLYNWQIKSYYAWKNSNYKGVIEAVTGAGKTTIAHLAILEHLKNDYKILILVPTVELQNQWFNGLKKLKDNYGNLIREKYKIFKMGGGNYHELTGWNIIVAVVHTAMREKQRERIEPDYNKGLLIADECHHYGSPGFQTALMPCYNRRLGLTATYQRNDDGIKQYLDPYFSGICFSLSYKQALEENAIAHFKIAYVGAHLGEDEREQYEEYEDKCRNLRNKLINLGLPKEPFGEFMRAVVILSKSNSPKNKTAGLYLWYFGKKNLSLQIPRKNLYV
jgi:RNA polymerase primary sigma factor